MHAEESRPERGEMDAEIAYAFLARLVSQTATEEIDRPHILICRDSETGAVTYSGPYRDGLAALAAAEQEREVDEATNDGIPLSFSVAALLDGAVPVPGSQGHA